MSDKFIRASETSCGLSQRFNLFAFIFLCAIYSVYRSRARRINFNATRNFCPSRYSLFWSFRFYRTLSPRRISLFTEGNKIRFIFFLFLFLQNCQSNRPVFYNIGIIVISTFYGNFGKHGTLYTYCYRRSLNHLKQRFATIRSWNRSLNQFYWWRAWKL